MPFVVDASVALSWCFEDEADELSRGLLTAIHSQLILVPPIWPLEVANALLTAERRERIKPADAARFLQLIADLPIEVVTSTRVVVRDALLSMARRHHLTAYDAQYLELAVWHRAALATRDQTLLGAAQAEGVQIWEPEQG